MPVKTFLNCTMPALVNIKVGSLRGTSGDDGTASWPFRTKYPRKLDLISLTPLIASRLPMSSPLQGSGSLSGSRAFCGEPEGHPRVKPEAGFAGKRYGFPCFYRWPRGLSRKPQK